MVRMAWGVLPITEYSSVNYVYIVRVVTAHNARQCASWEWWCEWLHDSLTIKISFSIVNAMMLPGMNYYCSNHHINGATSHQKFDNRRIHNSTKLHTIMIQHFRARGAGTLSEESQLHLSIFGMNLNATKQSIARISYNLNSSPTI